MRIDDDPDISFADNLVVWRNLSRDFHPHPHFPQLGAAPPTPPPRIYPSKLSNNYQNTSAFKLSATILLAIELLQYGGKSVK